MEVTMRHSFRVLLFLIGLALPFVVPTTLRAQSYEAKSSETAPEIKRYQDYFTDFHAAEQNETGEEFESTDFLQTTAYLALERMVALDYSLALYRSISSANDKAKAAAIVKAQVEYYSWQFKIDSDRISGMLKFVKISSTIQLGLKLKEDMRATKDRLDKITASMGLQQLSTK
jgi:hypothetical protein